MNRPRKKIPTTLSKAAKKRYLASGGDDCPFCGAESIELNFGEHEPMAEGLLEQKCTCEACGRQWVDTYRLVQVESIDPETGARD